MKTMKAKWALLIPLMTMIMAITPNTTYAAKSQPGLGENADDFITGIPAGVKVIPDIAYREGNEAWKLDLAMPKERGDAPRPAIIYIHGGGWTKGDKRGRGIDSVLDYAAKGFVSISVNYRLDVDKKACVEDVKCATRWLRAHAKKYNIDPNRIGAAGNSAGGHLALMLAVCPASAGLEGDGPYQEYSSMVQSAHCSSTPIMPGFRRGKGANQDLRKIQPMTYISADVPPLYLIHGTLDQKAPVSYADDFVKALREAGAKDITYKRYDDGTGHGAYVKHIEEARPAREAFFARTIGNKAIKALSVQPSPEQPNQQTPANPRRRNTGSRNIERTVMARWLSMDKDGDGKITKNEAEGQLKANFERNDANKDGFLDRGELDALSQRLSSARSRGRTPGDGRPAQQPQQQRPQESRPSSSLEAIKERIPEGVKFVPDIAYREGNEAWKLDLAMPEERGEEPRPAIVFVHGGGWRSGDKRKNNFLGPTLEFAAKGYVCITINYRLVNEAPMPACIEDVKCAVRWLRAHAKEYNVDPDRLGAYGNSAGAHLVAMLGLCPRSAALEGDGPWQGYSSMVQAVVCSATPTNFPFKRREAQERTDSTRRRSLMGSLFAGPEETLQQRLRQASPMTYVTADAPPFLIIHGTADRTVPVSQSDELAKALREAGAKDVTYMRIEGAGHGAFGQNIEKTGPAREAFFARTLKNKGVPNQGQSAQQKTAKLFERNDRNKDGQLSREEFPEATRRLFDRIDTDKDGRISLQEDVTYRKSRSSRRQTSERTTQQQSDRSRQSQLPADAKVERDIIYARVGDRELLLDLCLPAKGSTPLPVIVWVHGGGWRKGSKNAGSRARGMLDRGYAVVDVGYRLSGEAIFPAQVEDCRAAVRWVRANAAKYRLDPNRIGAWGSSAGGHLVAFLGTAGDVREFDTETNAEYSSRVQAVCDWFGPTDFLQMDKHSLKGNRLIHDAANSPESLLVGGPIQEKPYRALARKANPITYVTKDDPPILIMHGDKDMSVPLHQSELLYDALKKAGVDATFYVVKGAGHGLRDGEESSEKLFEIVADFFDRHLKTQKPRADSRSRRGARKRPQLRPPTHADVKYGPHERNVLDFYQAESDKPTPLVVYIHGGGFRGGSKSSLNAGTLQELLEARISVAAIQYRLVSDKPLPAAHHDSLRALQFMRSKAKQWNIDKTRVGAFGGSAGAQICMWLAFHDEMACPTDKPLGRRAEPSSRDPVQRESSRLTCVATSGGQTTMDFDWWMRWIPEYPKPHRDRTEVFGDITDEELRKIIKDISALSLITSEDPPIFMSYSMKPDDPVPADSSRSQGWKVHHVMFGVKLKEKMDKLGVEADLKYPGAQTKYRSNAAFFITKLKPDNE